MTPPLIKELIDTIWIFQKEHYFSRNNICYPQPEKLATETNQTRFKGQLLSTFYSLVFRRISLNSK